MDKIYLGGSCSSDERTLMVSIATALRENLYLVYCPFELQIENAWDYPQDKWAEKVFDEDISALDEADIFLMISSGRKSTAGTNWEQGYAYAKHKRIVVIQYNTEDTSLMTYCGCSSFMNTDKNNLIEDVLTLLKKENYKECKSVLT